MGPVFATKAGRGPRGGRGPAPRPWLICLGAALLALWIATGAGASGLRPNPANDSRLLGKRIDAERYDEADGCRHRVPPGMNALERWLEDHVRGESWGIYRCERLKD